MSDEYRRGLHDARAVVMQRYRATYEFWKKLPRGWLGSQTSARRRLEIEMGILLDIHGTLCEAESDYLEAKEGRP